MHCEPIVNLLGIEFYTEGPAVDRDGNCFFTSLSGGNIYRLSPDRKLTVWAKSKCPNGQIILSNNDHLICDSLLKTIARYDSNGRFKRNELRHTCAGAKIFSPNDLIADGTVGIYFTDSVRATGIVGFVADNGKEIVVAGSLDYPNGIALSKDGMYLFVAESYQNRIIRFRIKSPGIVEKKYEIFADLPAHSSKDPAKNLPDGIKVDANDNLWIAHYGMGCVHVVSPTGRLLTTIETGFPLTSNICLTEKSAIITGGYLEPGPGGLGILVFN